MAEERERSGGKTDYVWGRHDKHRNMINSTQPHPGPSAHRLPSIASTLRFNPCRGHLHLTSTPPFLRFALSPRPELAPRVAPPFLRAINFPPPPLLSWKSFWKKKSADIRRSFHSDFEWKISEESLDGTLGEGREESRRRLF